MSGKVLYLLATEMKSMSGQRQAGKERGGIFYSFNE